MPSFPSYHAVLSTAMREVLAGDESQRQPLPLLFKLERFIRASMNKSGAKGVPVAEPEDV